jgi:hypothetical protein
LSITGATANAEVTISAVQYPPNADPIEYGTTPFGDTDGNGAMTITGTFDEWTLGSWVEVVYVNEQSIGTLEFSIEAAPSGQCGLEEIGIPIYESTDHYPLGPYGAYSQPGSGTFSQVLTGPCAFTTGQLSGGTWITASYSDHDAGKTRTWTFGDSGGPSTDYCYVGYPRCLWNGVPGDANYPVIDYATISSTHVNSQTMAVATLQTNVTLWINAVAY